MGAQTGNRVILNKDEHSDPGARVGEEDVLRSIGEYRQTSRRFGQFLHIVIGTSAEEGRSGQVIPICISQIIEKGTVLTLNLLALFVEIIRMLKQNDFGILECVNAHRKLTILF
jgi:hypothetical protein